MYAAKVCLLTVLLVVALAAAQYNELFPHKPNKWTKECVSINDCRPCQGDLLKICVGGYCGCKFKYSFGGK